LFTDSFIENYAYIDIVVSILIITHFHLLFA